VTYTTQKTEVEETQDLFDLARLSDEVTALAHVARRAPANDAGVTAAPTAYPDFFRTVRKTGAVLALTDVVAMMIAFVAAGAAAWAYNILYLGNGFQSFTDSTSLQQLAVYTLLCMAAVLWLDAKGHYRQRLPYWEAAGHIATVVITGFMVSGFAEYVSKDSSSRLWMGLSWLLLGFVMIIGRGLARNRMRKNGLWQIPALMIGNGRTAQDAEDALLTDRSMGFCIVGKVSPQDVRACVTQAHWKHLMMQHGVKHLFLALEGQDMERMQVNIRALTRARVPCSIIPPWIGLPSSTLSPHHIFLRDVLILHDTNRLTLPMSRVMKRSFDIVMSSLALMMAAPLMLPILMMIKSDGGPAFFVQPRVGRGGKLFNCLKLRSMRVDAEEALKRYLAENANAAEEWQRYQKLKHDVRITRIGHIIRRYSLDEIPQLVNVLKGEMSLVGPRPIMVGQEKLYADDFGLYTSVLPGITGPWQVSGRNSLTFERRVALEATYARNWSLWQDIVIILKTFPVLFKRGQAF